MENILDRIREELEMNVDENIQVTNQHFFKEPIKCYGIRSATVSKIGKKYFQSVRDSKKADIYDLCDKLWESGYIEESFIACNWSYALCKKYEPADFQLFEKWISEYVNNWASCDTLCNHTVGEFIRMYPEYLSKLKEFTGSDNRWMRRASAVTLIIPARKGMFLKDILEIADLLLFDKDDLVQKGYGWMLKAASESHQQEVYNYVISKKIIIPRTALRYAIEKMPKELRTLAMQK